MSFNKPTPAPLPRGDFDTPPAAPEEPVSPLGRGAGVGQIRVFSTIIDKPVYLALKAIGKHINANFKETHIVFKRGL